MKREKYGPFIAAGVTAFCVVTAAILLFFLIFNAASVRAFFTTLSHILRPIFMGMILAFLFAEVNEQIHFTYFVITSATKVITPALLPLIVFIALAITEFITGTNWGMYIIALPIVIPLAQNLGADVTLAVSAVLSAGVFGSHICFYSDATVITSSATGCNNFDHAFTQAPYGLLAAAISAIFFLIAGFVMN